MSCASDSQNQGATKMMGITVSRRKEDKVNSSHARVTPTTTRRTSSLPEPICVYWTLWILFYFKKRFRLYGGGWRLLPWNCFSSQAGRTDSCSSTAEFVCRLYGSFWSGSHNLWYTRLSGQPWAWTRFAYSGKFCLESLEPRRMYPNGQRGQTSVVSALFSRLSLEPTHASLSAEVQIGGRTYLQNGGWQYTYPVVISIKIIYYYQMWTAHLQYLSLHFKTIS